MSITFSCGDEATEINLANVNAYAVQRLLDPAVLPKDYGGWDEAQLRAIHTRVMRLLNGEGKNALLLPPTVEQGDGRCTVYHGGRDAEYVTRRLHDFLRLITVALQRKAPVTFG